MVPLSDREFRLFQTYLHRSAGVALSDGKKALVSGRLERRLRERGLASYAAYHALLQQPDEAAEAQLAVDLLTTHETYFFREPRHFELLRDLAQEAAGRRRAMRVWSAACSSGEEPYSAAMVLQETQPDLPWDVLATDIALGVLKRACTGHFPEARATGLSAARRQRFCMRGTGPHAGTLLVQRVLRERVRFAQVNLCRPLPALGEFDLVFLRNVMIYFDAATKREVVGRVAGTLRPGGLLLVGHSESLNDIPHGLRAVAPSVYVRPEEGHR